ncbi:HGxxPAAW family protein [Planobispora rosea]|uniref:HGxxPAAW family protein n=1 Tax=Planobispora rosea TaxID=35762 RepID=UPI00083A75F7|nr:HGxxPAAW family protein [Planobispora rosea]
MSAIHGDYDMGHTVAGWSGVGIALTGFAGAGAALCAAWVPGIWIGLGVTALGGLVSWALHLAGWGKPSGVRPRDERDWRVKDPMTGHADCLGCRLAGRRVRTAAHGPAVPGPAAHHLSPAAS